MNLDDILADAFDETIQFIGEPLQYKGKTVKGVGRSVQFAEDLMEGGLLAKRGMLISVKIGSIPFPTVGDTLLFKGKGFRIVEVVEDNLCYDITCETSAK